MLMTVMCIQRWRKAIFKNCWMITVYMGDLRMNQLSFDVKRLLAIVNLIPWNDGSIIHISFNPRHR